MKQYLVYLAGPITGQTWGGSTDWRNEVRDKVHPCITTLSPLRAKQYLEKRSNKEGKIADSYEEYVLSSSKGITNRDRWDTLRSDIVFINMLPQKDRASIGTCIEIGWANGKNIPIILVIDKEGNVHDHSMVRECASFIVHSLDEGIEVLHALCVPERDPHTFAGQFPQRYATTDAIEP